MLREDLCNQGKVWKNVSKMGIKKILPNHSTSKSAKSLPKKTNNCAEKETSSQFTMWLICQSWFCFIVKVMSTEY